MVEDLSIEFIDMHHSCSLSSIGAQPMRISCFNIEYCGTYARFHA